MDGLTARILVVDDEPAIRLTLEALLRRSHYNVALAASGAEALAYLERHACDLVLLDLIMPGIDGLKVFHQIRVLQPAAAIIIFTGSDVLCGTNLEGYEYMLKTASPQAVLARITAALAQHTAVRQPQNERDSDRAAQAKSAMAEA